MHTWGDKDVDWQGINDAAEYIGEFCKKYGRIGGQTKEKYGTVRFYTDFCFCILNLTHPGHKHYGPYPKWASTFDIYYGPTALKYTGISWFMSKWQPMIYNMAYQNALKKWPHLRAEILDCADHIEMIKGVWRKEGKKTHILGWKGEIISTWESF